MRVLVTGATGFIGRNLLTHLKSRGHEVHALSRDPKTAEENLPVEARCFAWNYETREIDPSAFDRVDAVIHLAGENVAEGRWTEKKKRKILESRELGTNHLIDTIESLKEKPKILIAASAVGYYGHRGEELLSEESGAGGDLLAEICKRWEAAVNNASKFVARTVVVRIGIVLGRQGGALERMLPIFQLGLGGRLGLGTQWMPWVHVDDLSRLFLFLLENEFCSGPYNGTAPEPVTNADFTEALASRIGRRAFLNTPETLLKILMGEMAGIVLTSSRAIPDIALDAGFEFNYPKLGRALSHLLQNPYRELTREQSVPRPLDEVFPFYTKAENLEKVTPPFLHFNIKRVTTETMRKGTEVKYRIRLHGIPIGWTTLIKEWNPPHDFLDIQTKGPYKHWHHYHEFESRDGGTLIRDIVQYQLYMEPFSTLILGAKVDRDLKMIFAYRRRAIEKLFGK
jgi:uncharacterized protein (TIGR01777 family)